LCFIAGINSLGAMIFKSKSLHVDTEDGKAEPFDPALMITEKQQF